MTSKQISETIEKAIRNRTELTFTVKHGLGSTISETVFQAYILGDDIYQYAFIWGYLPGLNLYYKFMIDNIVFAEITEKKYDVREDACYQYAIEEVHLVRLVGFDNIYGQAARNSTTT